MSSDLIGSLEIDRKGSFHHDFVCMQLTNDTEFPHLPNSPNQDPSKSISSERNGWSGLPPRSLVTAIPPARAIPKLDVSQPASPGHLSVREKRNFKAKTSSQPPSLNSPPRPLFKAPYGPAQPTQACSGLHTPAQPKQSNRSKKSRPTLDTPPRQPLKGIPFLVSQTHLTSISPSQSLHCAQMLDLGESLCQNTGPGDLHTLDGPNALPSLDTPDMEPHPQFHHQAETKPPKFKEKKSLSQNSSGTLDCSDNLDTPPNLGHRKIKKKKTQIQPFYSKYTACSVDLSLAIEQPLSPNNPKDDVWCYASLAVASGGTTKDGGATKASGTTHPPSSSFPLLVKTILDCGNQSFDVTSMKVWESLRFKSKHPLPLEPYNRHIKGVGGATVQCFGKSIHPISISIPGLPMTYTCHPVIIDAPTFHFNFALASLKEGCLSMHFSPNANTVVECRKSGSKVSLAKRDALRPCPSSHSIHQICELLNEYTAADKPEEDLLMEINVLHQSAKPLLQGHQVLIEKPQGFSVAENLIAASEPAVAAAAAAACGPSLDTPAVGANPPSLLVDKCKYKLKQRSTFASPQEQICYPVRPVTVPARCHMYVECKSKFNLGQIYFGECNFANFSIFGLGIPRHIGQVKSTIGRIFVPITNLQYHPVQISPADALLWAHGLDWQDAGTKGLFDIQLLDADYDPPDCPVPPEPPDRPTPPDPPLHHNSVLQASSSPHHNPSTPLQPLLSPHAPHLRPQKKVRSDQQPATRVRAPIVSDDLLTNMDNSTWSAHSAFTPGREASLAKRQKINQRKFLSDIQDPKHKSPGFWVQGQVKSVDFQIDHKAINQKMALLKEQEANKIPLWQASRSQLDLYFQKMFKLSSNALLQDHPSFLPKILDVLYNHRKAFTATENDPIYKQESGFCSFYTYDPELKEGFKNHVYSAPVSKFSAHDEAQLLDILLRWEAKGVICRQDVRGGSHTSSPPIIQPAPPARFDTIPPKNSPDTQYPPKTPQHPRADPPPSQAPIIQPAQSACFDPIPPKLSPDSEYPPQTPQNQQTKPPLCRDPETLSSTIRSPHNYRIVLVKKRVVDIEGAPPIAKRFCLDVREINKHAVLHRFHLQSAASHIANLTPGRVFNTYDFSDFYSSVPLSAAGSRLFSFQTERFSSWSFLRIPQGFSGSPFVASQLSSALASQLPSGYLSIYSDDSLQSGQGPTDVSAMGDLLHKMDTFLQQVVRFGLKIAPQKCDIFSTQVTHLGFLISPDKISMKADCLQALTSYSLPSSAKSLKSFLGVISYYSGLVPHLSHHTASLFDAANRNTPHWKLTPSEISDFITVRRLFMKSPSIAYPRLDDLHNFPLRLYLDWSKKSISAILAQIQLDDSHTPHERLLGCLGKKNPTSLQEASSTRGESSALLLGLHKYRHFLLLAPFLTFSDNLSLYYLSNLKQLGGHYHRLFQHLSEFSFYMYTLKSSENTVADFISRQDMPPMTPEELRLLSLDDSHTPSPDDFTLQLNFPSESTAADDFSSPTSNFPPADDFTLQPSFPSEPTATDKISSPHSDFPSDVAETTGSTSPESNFPSAGNPKQPAPPCVPRSASNHIASQNIPPTHLTPHTLQNYPRRVGCSLRSASSHIDSSHIPPCISQFHHSETISNGKVHLIHPEYLYESHSPPLDPIDASDAPILLPPDPPIAASLPPSSTSSSTSASPSTSSQAPSSASLLCLPTMTNSDLNTLVGPNLPLLQSITREELCQRQDSDKDIHLMKTFASTSFPTLTAFHRLYPSERSTFLFSKRKLLFLSPDNVLCIRRSPAEQAMDIRIVLPLSLTYRTLLLTHCVGTALHRSVLTTFREINNRFLVHKLDSHVKFFIRACRLCHIAKAPKPNPKSVPALFPSFIKAKHATPDSLVYADLSGKIPLSVNGHDHFILYYSYFSDHVQLYPLRSCSSNAVLLSLTHYISNFPISRLITDPGSSFTSSVMRSCVTALRIQHNFSPIMSPRSELSENKIKQTKQLCRLLLSSAHSHRNWDVHLGNIQFAINSRISEHSGLSPNELSRLFVPCSPISRFIQHPPPPLPDTPRPQTPPFPISNIPPEELSHLRKSHPFYLQSKIDIPSLDLYHKFINKCVLAHNVIQGKLAAYHRAAPVYSRRQHQLFPLTEADIGRLVYRYIHKSPNPDFSRSMLSRWTAPWEIISVAGETFCTLKSTFLVRGKHQYMDSTIDLLHPYHADASQDIFNHASLPDVDCDFGAVPTPNTAADLCATVSLQRSAEQQQQKNDTAAALRHTTTSNPLSLSLSQARLGRHPGLLPAAQHNLVTYPALDCPPGFPEFPPLPSHIDDLCTMDSTCEVFLPPCNLQLALYNFDHISFLREIENLNSIPDHLLFHKIQPFQPKTRRISTRIQLELQRESDLMSTPYNHQHQPTGPNQACVAPPFQHAETTHPNSSHEPVPDLGRELSSDRRSEVTNQHDPPPA